MINNYFKTAFRKIQREKGYSIINISGLAIGMACFIMIFLWVQDELSYDKFHENYQNIYRVVEDIKHVDEFVPYAINNASVVPAMKENFPEILKYARYTNLKRMLVTYNHKRFYENGICAVDPEFFIIFSYAFVKGNPETSLINTNEIVITESIAQKYFGGENPVGKILNLDKSKDFTVTGVIKDVPSNSHLKFDMLTRYDPASVFGKLQHRSDLCYSYILLNESINTNAFNEKIKDFYRIVYPDYPIDVKMYLQPLTKIHLHSNFTMDIEGHGEIKYIYIFTVIAFFILLIACINFMNISTARAGKRAKEIGMRKVVGAKKSNIIFQFFGESILIAFTAIIFAVIIVELFIPVFNYITSKEISLNIFSSNIIFCGLISITIFSGIVSGSYPAVILSSFQPVKVFKGIIYQRSESNFFRRLLVTSQFTLSIILIICTLLIYKQVKYLKNKNIGIEKEHVISVPLREDLRSEQEIIKNELLQNTNILNVSGVSDLPTNVKRSSDAFLWEGQTEGENILMYIISTDYSLFKTLNIQLSEGRYFSKEITTDAENYILNETAVRQLRMTSPLNKWFSWGSRDRKGKIIGIIKDYNFRSLHNNIEPLVIRIAQNYANHLLVQIKSKNIQETINFLERIWKKFVPDYPFEYLFLDTSIRDFYKAEERMTSVFYYFTFLAIFISCMGLLGLSSFMIQQRTKEIGIRKALGASVSNILVLLSKEFFILVLISIITACPVSFYVMKKWLEDFAFHIDITPSTFIFSGIFALIIAFLTISYHGVRAATSNPVDSIKYE